MRTGGRPAIPKQAPARMATVNGASAPRRPFRSRQSGNHRGRRSRADAFAPGVHRVHQAIGRANEPLKPRHLIGLAAQRMHAKLPGVRLARLGGRVRIAPHFNAMPIAPHRPTKFDGTVRADPTFNHDLGHSSDPLQDPLHGNPVAACSTGTADATHRATAGNAFLEPPAGPHGGANGALSA